MTSEFAAGLWGYGAWGAIQLGALLALLAGLLGFLRKTTLARIASFLAATVALVGLTAQRESYRLMMLTGDYNSADETIRSQWAPFAMFGLVFVLGIVTLVWLFIQVRAAQKPTAVSPGSGS